MKHKLLLSLTILIYFSASGQISMKDSTVQTIGYWEKKEKQNYTITIDKYKLKGTDTTSREKIKYEVEITILDSTTKTYTIEWFYKNFSIDTDNEMMKRIMSIAEDMKVIIKTDENGSFTEVVNWQEVRDFMKKAIAKMKAELKEIPNIDELAKQVEITYSSKEAIEAAAVADVQQFYIFHGAKYKLGEMLEGKTTVPNLYGVEPLDCDFTLYLDEINVEDNNYIMRATQTVNKDQLIETTFNYMVNLSKKMGTDAPKKSDLENLKNEFETASRIHGSGWIIYSIQTKTVTLENTTSIDERIIEIK